MSIKKPVDTSKEVMVIKKEVSPLVVIAKKMEIKKASDMIKATDLLSQMNKIADKIETEKDKVLKPALLVVKAERGRWKPIEAMFEEGIEALREKMGRYQTEQVRISKQQENNIAGRIGEGKGHIKLETAVKQLEGLEKPETKIASESGIVKFRTDKKLKIVDESKVPDKYWVIDEKALLEALKGGMTVAGAEIEEIQVPINYR